MLQTNLALQNSQSELPLLRCLRAQSKKRLQQVTANGSQAEDRRGQRQKRVKDPGREISRLDVEDVSRTGMQLLSASAWTLDPVTHFLGLGSSASVGLCTISRALSVPLCSVTNQPSPGLLCLVHLDSGSEKRVC